MNRLSSPRRFRVPRLLFALLLLPAAAFAQLGDVWHVPDETRLGAYPDTMRDPLNPGTDEAVTFYQGNWKGGGGNQTGGTFYYRVDGGSWQTAPVNFHFDENPGTGGHVQIWKGAATMPEASGAVVDYYFAITFDNRTSPTYIYDNGGTTTTATQATAQASPFSFTVGAAPMSMTVHTASTGTLNADYTTTKIYADEVAGTSIPVSITFDTGVDDAIEAEVWTNLNNRDRADQDADGDGIHDGIVPPPAPDEKPPAYSGGPYPEGHYFQAHPMTSQGGGVYTLTLNATKTGAYRLSARYRTAGGEWQWYSSAGRRDHCITVAPTVSREMNVYEINVLNIDAAGPTFADRSTFESLTDSTRWNLNWLRNMGANTLWFQPIHPNAKDNVEPSGGWNEPATPPYDPGSPYAVKNFFEVMEIMTENYDGGATLAANRAAAMAAFQEFVQVADAQGVHIMLDAPFNHTAYDVEVSGVGLQLFNEAGLNTAGWSATDQIRNREARFFSRNDGAQAYGGPASSAANIAVAPDRNDFGKWYDVADVYFGRYATLVIGNPDADTSRNTVANEQDWLNYDDLRGEAGSNGAVTRAVWKYFAAYVPHWLEQTGLPPGASLEEQTYKGIDGLRADFGQGMPPQFWEYCINVARKHKWSFVFMTESLDGGAVTYRSNRHFDILNENIVFPWQVATTTSAHRGIFEDRRNAYGMGLVLLNNTSHDEAGYADPWEAFIRYAVGGTIDGAPMVMYGQEIGTADNFSFDFYELNFGKNIPHFKRYNSMQPQWTAWAANSLGVRNLYPAYAGVGQARESSPALRSSNRWFLNPVGDNDPDEQIFAVAKYEAPGASPAVSDVVFGFINLDRANPRQNSFAIPPALGDLLGIKPGRTYNVRNIAAYQGPDNEYPTRREALLWGASGRSGSDILATGLFVALNAVPATDIAWGTAPYEAQYLRLLDVTTPPQVSGAPAVSAAYTVDGSASVSWDAAVDEEGLAPLYVVAVMDADGNPVTTIETTETSIDLDDLPFGSSYTFAVTAANPNDPSKAAAVSPASTVLYSLNPAGDEDGDGMNNVAEVVAGTDPFDPGSILRAAAGRDSSDVVITWNPVGGRTYAVQRRASVTSGSWQTVATGLTDGEFREEATGTERFYRVIVEE